MSVRELIVQTRAVLCLVLFDFSYRYVVVMSRFVQGTIKYSKCCCHFSSAFCFGVAGDSIQCVSWGRN